MSESRIPEDKTSLGSFNPITEIIYEQARTILEEEPSPDDFESYKLARDHYKACVNEEKQNELGIKPLEEKLKEFGGWPVIEGEDWSDSNYKWWEVYYKLNEAGFDNDILVRLSVEADDKNSTWRIIKLDQAETGLSREYLIKGFEDKDIQTYYKYIVDFAVLMGAPKERAEVEIKQSLLFEIELAKITLPREERRNATQLYNPMLLGEIPTHGLFPSWTEFVQKMFLPFSSVEINENETVIVQTPEFFKKLSKLLLKTEVRTLANYIGWRASRSVLGLLNEEARNIRQKYRKNLYGLQVIFFCLSHSEFS